MKATRHLRCCVPECGRNSGSHLKIRFHSFPKKGTSFLYVLNESDVETKMDRRKVWEMVLLLPAPAAPHHRVCSMHFTESDYYKPDEYSAKSKLYNTAIPTMHLPQKFPTIEANSQFCMVKNCGNSTDYTCEEKFYTLSPKKTQKWTLWKNALGVEDHTDSLIVCSNHFYQGAPSENPEHIDYVPSINLHNDIKIEEVKVSDSYMMEADTNSEDPLKITNMEADPVEDEQNEEILEADCIKVETEEHDVFNCFNVETELDVVDCLKEHSYCK